MIIFADSSAYIAYYNKRDKNHNKAISLVKKIKEREFGPVIIYTSDYVFDEVITVVLVLTKNKDLAIKIGESIKASKITKIVKIDEEIFHRAWEIFKKHRDKLWSFTDCTSFAIMKKMNIKTALTFDKHYKQAGFNTIP